MSDNLTEILIVGLTVLGPIWIVFHYIYKFKNAKSLSDRDLATCEALGQTAALMEARMATLERLLDAEAPGWRTRDVESHPATYQQAHP